MEIVCLILAAGVMGSLCLAFYYRSLLRSARQEQNRLAAEVERRQEELYELSTTLEKRFSELAAQALAGNSEVIRRASVNSVAEVLQPMKDNIESFRKTIASCYDAEARERFALDGKITQLIELNRTIGNEAARLTTALKGNSRVQGEWGEMILGNILQAAGFRCGIDYEVQQNICDSEGKQLRPDVVISYADGRRIVIDSKVSIQDYLNMLSAEDEDVRKVYARSHVNSVRKHVGELARKSYQDAAGHTTFDYVLMFIPNEGAFLSAMDLDSTLWQSAYDSRVLIVSPTHLLSVLKLVEQMWRQEKQNSNFLAIADEAANMLNKFQAFVADLDKIDKSLAQARDAWDAAYNKLSTGKGNLINRARKIELMGAKSQKSFADRVIEEDDEAVTE